jgi:hypothetical protein
MAPTTRGKDSRILSPRSVTRVAAPASHRRPPSAVVRRSPSSAVRRRPLQIPPPEWPPLLFTGPSRRRGRGRRAVGGGAAGRIWPRPPRAPPRTRHGGGVRALPGRSCGGGAVGHKGEARQRRRPQTGMGGGAVRGERRGKEG